MARHAKDEAKKDRRHGGTLTEIEKGRLYAIDMTVDGQRIRERFKGNKTEAAQRMEALRTSAKSGVQVDKRKLTYADYSMQYFKNYESRLTDVKNKENGKNTGNESDGKRNIRLSTLKQYLCIQAHIVNSSFGKKRIVDITSQDVNDLLSALRKEGVGQTTLYQIYTQIKRIFSAAIEDRIIQFNPVNRNVLKPVLPEPDRHALSRNEANRLKQAILKSEPNACTLAVLIALSTGLRIGEILGLTRGNTAINCAEPHFNVIQQRTKERIITERKTSKKGRTPNPWVPIDPQLEEVLNAWLAYQAEHFRAALDMDVTEDTPLCSNAVGGWSDTHNIEKRFKQFCIENGFGGWFDDEGKPIITVCIDHVPEGLPDNAVIEYRDATGWPVDENGKRYSRSYPRPKVKKHYRGLKFHELRKTCFTLRLDRGESIKTLQEHGGWFSPRMLLENYGESVEESVKEVPNFLGYLEAS